MAELALSRLMQVEEEGQQNESGNPAAPHFWYELGQLSESRCAKEKAWFGMVIADITDMRNNNGGLP